MLDTLNAVLENKGRTIHRVSPDASVLEAIRAMNEHKIGALLVSVDHQLAGIFTERDVLSRVVDPGRDPNTTRVEEVMTRQLVVVRPSTTVEEAMAVMTEKRCRHLPVVDGGELQGLVSIGDLTRWVNRNQRFQIKELINYITGQYPA
jgi:CBS domain-containing protein